MILSSLTFHAARSARQTVRPVLRPGPEEHVRPRCPPAALLNDFDEVYTSHAKHYGSIAAHSHTDSLLRTYREMSTGSFIDNLDVYTPTRATGSWPDRMLCSRESTCNDLPLHSNICVPTMADSLHQCRTDLAGLFVSASTHGRWFSCLRRPINRKAV
jgi:hypothetical protein